MTFTTTGSSALFAWGAHIAQSGYWVNKTDGPNGAARVSGAPWHMRTQNLDGSGNKNQDRSIQPSAIIEYPNVLVTKVADDATISAGQDAGYTITVTNQGPGVATGVTLHDPLPSGVTWTESPDNPDCSITAGTLDCDFGDMAENATESVHIVGATTAADCGTLTNTATVDALNEGDAFGGDNSATATITVQCPDLAITKVADKGTVTAGDQIGYTITVTNNGPGKAFDVVMHDTLPTNPGLKLERAGHDRWLELLDRGRRAHLRRRGIRPERRRQRDGAHRVADDGGHLWHRQQQAPGRRVERREVSTGVITITVECASLGISKVADDSVVSAGDTIGYTITVTNSGAGTAKGVVVTDTLPTNDGLVWTIDAANSDSGCSIAAGDLTCNFGDMASGTSKHVHLTSPTTAATCGEVVNAASATTTNDGNPSTGDVTITVNCPAISVDKTADAETVDAADQVGFTITVANAGPGTAYDVMLADTLPTNDGLDWSIDGGTGAQFCDIANGELTCDFGDMAAETSYTVHITSDTDATTCGEIDNTATVTISNGDGDSDDASITVNCPDLGIDIRRVGPTWPTWVTPSPTPSTCPSRRRSPCST